MALVQFTRTSMLTGVERTFEFDINEKDYDSWLKGELIQNAFPYLSADDREFIMTGITKEEWDGMVVDE